MSLLRVLAPRPATLHALDLRRPRTKPGFPADLLVRSREGLAAADERRLAYTRSQALYLSSWLHQVRDEPEIVEERTAQLIALAEEKRFPSWAADGILLRGWALAAEGEVAMGLALMEQAIAARQAMPIGLQRPYYLGLVAGVHLVAGDPAEALARLDEAATALHSRRALVRGRVAPIARRGAAPVR